MFHFCATRVYQQRWWCNVMYIDECIKVCTCGGFLSCVLGSVSNNQSTLDYYATVAFWHSQRENWVFFSFLSTLVILLWNEQLDCYRELYCFWYSWWTACMFTNQKAGLSNAHEFLIALSRDDPKTVKRSWKIAVRRNLRYILTSFCSLTFTK